MEQTFKIITQNCGQFSLTFLPKKEGEIEFYHYLISPFVTKIDEKLYLNQQQINTLELQKKISETYSRIKKDHPEINKLLKFFEIIPLDEYFIILPREFKSSKEEWMFEAHVKSLNHSSILSEQQKFFHQEISKVEKLLPNMLDNFDIYSPSIDKKKSIGEKSKDKRRCRFCDRAQIDGATFKKIAHAIPFALGNKNLILNEECDSCNEYFGSSIEPNFIYQYDILRSFHGLEGRGGNIKIKTKDFLMHNNNGQVFINAQQINVSDAPDGTITTRTGRVRKYTPEYDYKLLCKIALSIIPRKEIGNYQETIKWLRFNEKPSREIPNILVAKTKTIVTRVAAYKKKNNEIELPNLICEFCFCGFIFVFPVPLSSTDDGIEMDLSKNKKFKETFLHYKLLEDEMKPLDLSSPIETEAEDVIKFIKYQPKP